jgi:biotin carboxyl carrier protein
MVFTATANSAEESLLKKLEQLRQFREQPAQFWQACLDAMGEAADATCGVLLLRGATAGEDWRRLAAWTASGESGEKLSLLPASLLRDLADAVTQQGGVIRELSPAGRRASGSFVVAARLDITPTDGTCVAIFLLEGVSEETAAESLLRLRLLSNIASVYQLRRDADQARADAAQYASVLDLMVVLNDEKRFVAAAMALCNEIASRHKCDRVSLGWLQGSYVRMQAISHTEKFEKKMEAVALLEAAMEECLDQDEEVVFPRADTKLITRDHEKFSREQTVPFLCSIPLRVDGKAVAVLLCERTATTFTELEVRLLRLSADLAARRLSELKQRDRWFGARWATATKEGLGKLVGVEHTWAKVGALLGAIALAILIFWKVDYRVEAPCILRTDEMSYVSAPFNGFISEVNVRVGDEVKQGEPLMTLDTRDLLLEEAAALAEFNRYERESEKARAADNAAEIRVAESLARQAKARLDLARHRLRQAALNAPMSGIVIEGDLRERIGAPVEQGNVLFKIGRTEKMFVLCEVNEKDIHDVNGSAFGEFALASQPKHKFPLKLERIEPVAQTKEKGNVFLCRAVIEGAPQDWWRPGMSGVAKINVGQRSLLWVLTRRTVDFLRMFLWW